MPYALVTLIALAGWLCIVWLATRPKYKGGAIGWLIIAFGLYQFLNGERLNDMRFGGVVYAVVGAAVFVWWRGWGRERAANASRPIAQLAPPEDTDYGIEGDGDR